jgi:outer membrane autotransporter protein
VLTLIGEGYSFSFNNTLLPGSGAVYVGGDSTLWLQAPEVAFNTAHFELGGPSGGSELQPASYYDPFDPGSILKIGAEGEDEDGEEEDGGDDDGPSNFLANVIITTGSSTFETAGTIDMVNGLAGDRLTVVGPYEAHDANLALDSFVKDTSSPTDRLTLAGPVFGKTTIYVNNLNLGQGAYTGKGNGDGIQLVAAPGLDDDSFRLGVNNISGQREVTSGAFSYRLAIDGSGAYLQSDILDQVPGYVMAGAVADRHVYAGIETLYQRMGELRTGPVATPNLKDSDGGDWKVDSVWARGNFSNYDVDVAKGWDFDSDTNGFLIGVDPSRPVGQDGVVHLGVFAGYNATDATVDGFTWGHRSPTKVEVDGWTVGGYATYFNRLTPGQGFYADLVGKVDGLNLDINNGNRHTHDSTDAAAYTGSAEIGYGFAFGGGWSLQPNGEITFISVDQGNYESKAYGFDIHPEDADSAVGRLGIQLQDTMYNASGAAITPYANFNVLSEFDGGSKTLVGGTAFASDLDGTWYDVGAGITAAWSTRLALYGNIDYKFGDVEGLGGTVGARVHW